MADYKMMYEELKQEVQVMRNLQKQYFQFKDNEFLYSAKKAEKRVDYLIEKNLFTEE